MNPGVATSKVPWIVTSAFTLGLKDGYLGQGKFQPASLGAVSFKMFFCSLPQLLGKGGLAPVYYDHYHSGEQTGFGFDYVEIEDPVTKTIRRFVRVYAGGTVPKDKLAELGLGEKDVTEALKCFLTALGDRTRLDQAKSIQNGNWIYVYDILEDTSGTFGNLLILADESMYYFTGDGSGVKEPVFTHYIILIEVK